MLLSKNVTGGGQNLGKNWQALAQNNLCKSASSNLKLFALILINKIEKIWIESETIPPSPTPLVKLKKKKAGTVVLEVIFTLPLVFYMVFFCVELIRINITNDALQTICEEATFLTSAHNYESGPDLIAKIDAIIEKHRPRFIPQKAPGYSNQPFPVIRYHFDVYTNAQEILSNIPYGGTTVAYTAYESGHEAEVHAAAIHNTSFTNYAPVLDMEYNPNPENYNANNTFMRGSGIPSNYIFVLQVSCNYPFSNSLVKLLFNKGINTRIVGGGAGYSGSSINHKKGTMYLLYARGAGIVGKKK